MRYQTAFKSLLSLAVLFLPVFTFAGVIQIVSTAPFPATVTASSTTNATYSVVNTSSIVLAGIQDQSTLPAGMQRLNTSTCGSNTALAPGASCTIQLELQAPANATTLTGTLREQALPTLYGAQLPLTVGVTAAPIAFTVTPSGDGHETISPATPKTVNHGSTQNFTVTANSGYTVSSTVGGTCPAGSWSGSTYTTGAISSSCSVSFSASLNTYTVTPSGDGHETISPSSPQTVNEGDTQDFTVTPNSGYTVSSTVGGSCPAGSWSGSTYTTGAISSSCSVSFSASQNTYTVTPSGDGNESISPSSPQTVNHGSTQNFTVTADSGYTVSPDVAGSCPAGSWSGSVYTTGAITSTCTVTFAAVATPTVTGLMPNSGSYEGGTTIAIQGTNFTSDATVKFGTTSAAVVSTSSNSITVTAPPHDVGYDDVTVTVSGVTSATSTADQFTYGQQYLYVVSSGGAVYSCIPNAGGAPTSCILASGALLTGKTLIAATVTSIGPQQYAYVLVNANPSYQTWACSISNSSPDFDSCQSAYSGTLRTNGITFATINGTQFAYIASQNTRGGGVLQKCSINSDKTLTCTTAYSDTPPWNSTARLTSVAFRSVNNTLYVYLANNVSPGRIYYCPMLSDGNVDVANCHTSTVFPSSTTPGQMAFIPWNGTLYDYIAQTAGSAIYNCSVSNSGDFSDCYSSSISAASPGLQMATFSDDSAMAYLETGTAFNYCTLNGPSSHYTLNSCTDAGSGISSPISGTIGFLAF
jgi:hypothetical protein